MKQIAHIRFLFVAFFALAAAQSAWAAVVDMGGATTNITDLGAYVYNGTAIKNNTLQNGTLNVTGNQVFADGMFTFGSGLTLNQTADQWGVSGERTVKLVDGATLNYTSTKHLYFGRLESSDVTVSSGTTQFILDNGIVNSSADISFTPRATSTTDASGKDVVLNFTMINGSILTTLANGKNVRFGGVHAANSKKHKTEKVTVAVTDSTISVGKLFFGDGYNNLEDNDNSYINATFGPGADITCRQFYVYKYPTSTVKFDGAVAHTAASVDPNFFGKPSASTFAGYELLAGGVTIDVTNDFTHSDAYAHLFGEGGFTKTGSGTLTYNRDAFKFTGPLTVSNGTFISTQKMAASAFNVDGASSILNLSNASLTNATVSLAATAGGTLTLAGANITDSAPDLTLAGGGKTDYFTRDGVVGAYTFDSLTIGEGAVLDLDANTTAIDAISATTTNIMATSANRATININFTAAPAAGATFTFFETDSADKFTVNPKLGSLTIPNEVTLVDGVLTLTITADDYTWNGSQTNWGDAGAWTKNDASADWSDGNNAIFSTANATATLAANAAASEVRFTADTTVSGSGSLTAAKVNVAEDVAATISAPTSGSLEKTGEGTLTLGANRSEDTILTEGTLAMANGATVDPAKLTLGTDAAKPVTFDYGGQTLTANPAAYFGAGMDVTLTNGVFAADADIKLTDANSPATLTIAKDAEFLNANRYIFNTDSEKTINIAGGEFYPGSTNANKNVFVMNNSSGRMRVNATDGSVIKMGGSLFAGTGHDSSGLSPKLEWSMSDSSIRIEKGMFLGNRSGYTGWKYPIKPECRFSMTNSVFYAADGIAIGQNPTDNATQHEGYYIAEFDDSIVTSKFCRIYGDRPASRLHYNGVELVSSANNDNWIDAVGFADDVTPVTVGAKGLVLNTNGKTMKIKADLGGSGAVTKTGAGTLTIATNQTSTAVLNVNEGAVAVDGGVTVARAATVASGATLTVNGTAETTVDTLALEAGSTLNIASGTFPLSVAALTLPDSGKVTLTHNGGAFSAGIYKILEKTGITTSVAEKFDPSTGSEGYSFTVSGNTLVLNVGSAVHGRWKASAGSGNFSDPGNWEDGQVPVAGDELDFSGVTNAITITCGDMSETSFGAVNLGTKNRQITINGTLRVASMEVTKNDSNFTVQSGSKLIVDGDVTLTADDDSVRFIVYNNNGAVEIGGRVIVSKDVVKGYPCYQCSSSATISAKGIVCNSTNDNFMLNAYFQNTHTVKWIIGSDGLANGSGAKSFWIYRGDGSNKRGLGAELKAADSFSVDSPIGSQNILTLDTAESKSINVNGEIYMGPMGDSVNTLTVKGSGSVKICNTVARPSDKSAFTGDVVVTNMATLAINAGKQVTTGTIIVNDGATLQVAESGTVALGGGLTLKAGAALGFNYTTRNEPVLDLTNKTVTFDEGATTNVVVKITTTDGKRAKGGANVLTSGGKFEGVTVSIDESYKPTWVRGISVDGNGEIVLDVKPLPTLIIVR